MKKLGRFLAYFILLLFVAYLLGPKPDQVELSKDLKETSGVQSQDLNKPPIN